MTELKEATVADLFADQVRSRPDSPALRFRGEQLSYARLDELTDVLARRLRAAGVGPEVVVGVCVERSLEMIIAVLAVVKAGGAYLPVHPDEPAERFRYMIERADARILLTHAPLAERIPELVTEVWLVDRHELATATTDESFGSDVLADNLVYICYTSGSTGQPKGVAVPHRGVVRLVRDTDYADFGPDETYLQLCSLTFDPAAFEIWGALLNGGCLVIYPPGTLSLAELGECLRAERISTLWLTTGLFHRMVDDQLPSLGGLRQLLAGGDTLSPAHINRVRATHPHVRLVNGYGPTENTCFTTCHEFVEQVGERVPIGVAITGTRIHVLDDDLRPVPDGEWGQLYTGGAGLARGYASTPALTAERFLPDPFEHGERMYAIGDVVRRVDGGVLEFRGRVDDQVKIGGYRVELGEIVTALVGQPRVKECVVIVRDDVSGAGKVLVAYVVPTDDEEGLLPQLRSALHERLPRHMIPSLIVVLERMPLTRNGKIDRKALPKPDHAARDVDTDYEAPRTRTEALLADLWADTLAVDEVGVHDNFFELGGDSLLAADLLASVRKVLSARQMPSARLFFESATVAELAALVDNVAGSATDGDCVDSSGREDR